MAASERPDSPKGGGGYGRGGEGVKKKGAAAADRLRRRILSEWRGVYVPPDLSGYERRIGDLVARVVQRSGVGDRLAHEEIAAEWEKMVGPFLAAQSRPTALRRGVLEVSVVQSAVRYELERQWKRDVLKRLKETFGESRIRDVRFIPG